MMFFDCPAYQDRDGAVRCGLSAEVTVRFPMRSSGGPAESVMIRSAGLRERRRCDHSYVHNPACNQRKNAFAAAIASTRSRSLLPLERSLQCRPRISRQRSLPRCGS